LGSRAVTERNSEDPLSVNHNSKDRRATQFAGGASFNWVAIVVENITNLPSI
jgi:hypothetical protein